MRDSDPAQAFLEKLSSALCGDRRWKQETIAEICAHLLDALDDVPRELATFENIVERFGDPARLATALNRQHALSIMRAQVVRAGRLSAIAATLTVAVAVAAASLTHPSPPDRPRLNTVVLTRATHRVERPQMEATTMPIDGALLGLSR